MQAHTNAGASHIYCLRLSRSYLFCKLQAALQIRLIRTCTPRRFYPFLNAEYFMNLKLLRFWDKCRSRVFRSFVPSFLCFAIHCIFHERKKKKIKILFNCRTRSIWWAKQICSSSFVVVVRANVFGFFLSFVYRISSNQQSYSSRRCISCSLIQFHLKRAQLIATYINDTAKSAERSFMNETDIISTCFVRIKFLIWLCCYMPFSYAMAAIFLRLSSNPMNSCILRIFYSYQVNIFNEDFSDCRQTNGCWCFKSSDSVKSTLAERKLHKINWIRS